MSTWASWEKGKEGVLLFFFSWCYVPSILILIVMRLSTFPSSFFQNSPTNFTGLSEEECPRDWQSAFSKMEKTDGRQAPLYSLVYSEHLGWKAIITINPGNSSGEAVLGNPNCVFQT